MCLDCIDVDSKKVIRRLESREDGYIWLWKVFDLDKYGNLVGQFHKYDFYEGKNTAGNIKIMNYQNFIADVQYEPGFHCCLTKKEAEAWLENSVDTNRERVVVPIKVRRTWITTIGYQEKALVVVCKHIII